MPRIAAKTMDAGVAPTAAAAGSDRQLQLLREPQRPAGPHAFHYIRHPQVLALRGIPVRCPACDARRDWLLINQGRNTWIHCRCNNEWHEPEITRSAFEVLTRLPDTATYSSVEEGVAALGFDGSFAGLYLE